MAGLNDSKGNMYPFVTHTFNTIKGECPHNCKYCYMKRWGKQKPPRFDKNELKIDLGNNNFIFVGSSCDMFSDGIPSEWIKATLSYLCAYRNKYLFQSKNPYRFYDFRHVFPDYSVFCTTIESNRFYPDIMGASPEPTQRTFDMGQMKARDYLTYVTIEPILDFDMKEMVDMMSFVSPEQINIGADSGNHKMQEPPKDKILELIYELENFTKVFKKDNLKRLLK